MAVEKERLPYLPLYVNDLTSDELVEAMSTEEFGAYMFLLFKAWKSDPPATIPDDDQTLARYSRLTIKRWLACRERILAPWKPCGDNRLVQKRLLQVHGEVMARINQKREAGAKGGRSRVARIEAQNPSTAQAPLEAPLKHRLDFASSETPSRSQAEAKQSKSKTNTKNVSNDTFTPPNPLDEFGCVCVGSINPGVVSLRIGDAILAYDENPLVWRHEFIKRWNSLPGVRKHDRSDLSSPNMRLLFARLQENDWLWQAAMAKFPLWTPSPWEPKLSWFLGPDSVAKILDGDYEPPKAGSRRQEQTIPDVFTFEEAELVDT